MCNIVWCDYHLWREVRALLSNGTGFTGFRAPTAFECWVGTQLIDVRAGLCVAIQVLGEVQARLSHPASIVFASHCFKLHS